MSNESKSRPIKVFRCGPVQAALWTNARIIDKAVVQVHSIRIDKSYKDGDQWKRTVSFTPEDLPKVWFVAIAAYKHLRLQVSAPARPGAEHEYPEGDEAPRIDKETQK